LGRAEAMWEDFWAATRTVELTEAITAHAGHLAGRYALRGADAVYVASLLAVRRSDALRRVGPEAENRGRGSRGTAGSHGLARSPDVLRVPSISRSLAAATWLRADPGTVREMRELRTFVQAAINALFCVSAQHRWRVSRVPRACPT